YKSTSGIRGYESWPRDPARDTWRSFVNGRLVEIRKVVCKDRTVTTMTSTTHLPRITPASTPLPTGVTQPPPRSQSATAIYVPYPPKELTSAIDFIRIPKRVNPLAPPPPRRRINWTWETTDQHYENEKRSLLMQKREHTRYHSAWGKAFYGAPAEKEAYSENSGYSESCGYSVSGEYSENGGFG
ncbi:hypothetical protein MAR_010770, partial [Mya arenaria]